MALETLGFHVTDRCQLDCQHCLRDPEQKPRDLDVELVRRVIHEAHRKFGTRHIAYTGGEPTLHPRFLELIDAVVDEGMSWHHVSNGRSIDRLLRWFSERPARREAMTAITFSLDGATEAVHDGIRGEGSYREVMRAFSLCTATALKFTVQMTVNGKNLHEVEAFALLAAQLGASAISLNVTQPTGTIHDRELFVPEPDLRALRDRVLRLRELLTVPIIAPEGHWVERPLHNCVAFNMEQIHVDMHGRLNICCMHSGIPTLDDPALGHLSDVAADLNQVSLAEALAPLQETIAEAKRRQLAYVTGPNRDPWDHYPCNRCLQMFGKPYWTDQGSAGAQASRERWQGAWAVKNRLPLLP